LESIVTHWIVQTLEKLLLIKLIDQIQNAAISWENHQSFGPDMTQEGHCP